MRRLILFPILPMLAILAATTVCCAQCPSDKHQFDIAVSYGLLSATQLADRQNTNITTTSNTGNLFVTARYFLFNRLALGFTGGMLKTKGGNISKYDPSAHGSYETQINTVAMELYYIYFFRKYLEVYTLAGVGPGFYTTTTHTDATPSQPASVATESHNAMRLQYTPIGVRAGGRIGVFAELGVGYKGILNAGISFKLGPSCWWR